MRCAGDGGGGLRRAPYGRAFAEEVDRFGKVSGDIYVGCRGLAVVRSYLGYYAGSHQNSAAKRPWARIVLPLATRWKVLVSYTSCVFLLIHGLLFCIPLSFLARGTGLPRDFGMLRPSSAYMVMSISKWRWVMIVRRVCQFLFLTHRSFASIHKPITQVVPSSRTQHAKFTDRGCKIPYYHA